MSLSFAGLGLMSLRAPFADFLAVVLAKTDLRSVFCFIVLFIVLLVLAYLTNPSENSFRAYLTELSFRHHLTRLDDNIDDDRLLKGDFDSSSFTFASRASVSLRTPKHVFHSFGILTLAAMVPLPKPVHPHDALNRDTSIVSDSWYIGAFGKWWRGGIIDAWYQDLITSSSDEESWTSGILAIKALDKPHPDSIGLPFSTRSNILIRGSPPKLRNRDRSAHRSAVPASRSGSPPPLPKSASLPLHATRPHPSSIGNGIHPPTPSVAHQSSEQPASLSPPISRSSSAVFDQSPRIAEVLRQIAASKASVLDLRNQLSDHQSASDHSHSLLQAEVDSLREKKRQEDASRSELKSRTKTLEDSKRAAESTKRDAEKRLKAAENARDTANQRMEHLEKEIASLQQRLVDDEASIQTNKQGISDPERELVESLEQKKQEIKVAEDVVTALNLRAKELEEKLASEKERLKLLRERVNTHLQEQLLLTRNGTANFGPSDLPRAFEFPRHTDLPASTDVPVKSPQLLLGFNGLSIGHWQAGRRSKGYSIFDEDLAPLTVDQPTMAFSPFSDLPSPTTNGLITTMPISRSFQSETDVIMDKDWRNGLRQAAGPPGLNTMTTSPVSVHGSFQQELDPFEVRYRDDPARGFLHRTQSDPNPNKTDGGDDKNNAPRRWFSTSSKDKPRKGLNPDAKEFSLSGRLASSTLVANPAAMSLMSSHPSYDALNPNGLAPMHASSPSTTNTSLLRAFAPSPAEREALQRALGGSSNTSLERLPSLSDVGSIPSSPSHIHVAAPAAAPSVAVVSPRQQHAAAMATAREVTKLPSWLQSLPRIRKPNFSPWEDEEVYGGGVNVDDGAF